MSPTVTIEIQGLDRLRRKFGELEGVRWMRGVLVALGSDVKHNIAQAPGPVSHPIRWASERQRRWYFAMRRERGLPIGYTRESDPMSERLLGGWNQAVSADGLTVTVGNRASYGRFVMDETYQQGMHKDTGWRTIQQVAKEIAPELRRKAAAALRRILGR